MKQAEFQIPTLVRLRTRLRVRHVAVNSPSLLVQDVHVKCAPEYRQIKGKSTQFNNNVDTINGTRLLKCVQLQLKAHHSTL
jgi:hypothetical protein